jgi:hypothetical protein
VECAGYEEKRQIEPRSSRASAGATSSSKATEDLTIQDPDSPGLSLRNANSLALLYPKLRPDGLPLVGLPTNPRTTQRPHPRARDILAYHQYLFRTLPLLFPAEHLPFWREKLCDEAWETEYIFLAIAALGGLHRAVLMMAAAKGNDKRRGLDTKVIAVKTYTETLERLSEAQGSGDGDIFIAALVLLAYFEARCRPLCDFVYTEHS